MNNNRLYFQQWLSGVDFGSNNQIAKQMRNFTYAVGDTETRELLLIDPAYDVTSILDMVNMENYQLSGILITHYHADHAGGSLMGIEIEGIREILQSNQVPIHINKEELNWMKRSTGIDESYFASHESGDKIKFGTIEATLIHTPGHTPGSQCFLIEDMLVSGDTLFLEGCGRTDLPGSDPEKMYESITTKLAKISDSVTLYPGHFYSDVPFESIAVTKEKNPVLQTMPKDQWLNFFT